VLRIELLVAFFVCKHSKEVPILITQMILFEESVPAVGVEFCEFAMRYRKFYWPF